MAFDILSILNGATLAETERTEEYQISCWIIGTL